MSDLFAIQGAHLWKFSQQSQRDDLADSWGRGQDLVLCMPHRAFLDGDIEVVIYIVQLLLKPVDVGLDPAAYRLRGSPKAILLRSEHTDELAPTSQHRRQLLCLRSKQWAWLWLDTLCKQGQRLSVYSIGFSQSASGACKVSGLTGVDHPHRHTANLHGGRQGHFILTGGLHQHQLGLHLLESRNQLLYACLVVGGSPRLTAWAYGYIQVALGNINPNVDTSITHVATSFPAHPCKFALGLPGQATVRAQPGNEMRRPKLSGGLSVRTQGESVCRIHRSYYPNYQDTRGNGGEVASLAKSLRHLKMNIFGGVKPGS